MKTIIVSLLTVFLAACSGGQQLRGSDYFDAGTTALAIAGGATEASPLVGMAGDTAAPVVSLGGKWIIRNGLPLIDVPQDAANAIADSAGMLGGCANLALVLNLAAFPATLGYGAFCAAASLYHDREIFSVTPETINWPVTPE